MLHTLLGKFEELNKDAVKVCYKNVYIKKYKLKRER